MTRAQMSEDDLLRIISGDVTPIPLLNSQAEITKLAQRLSESQRTLGPDAVKRVLSGLLQRHISPEQAQRWASFVRWGLISTTEMKVNAIDIPKQANCEETIVDAISRLDELGDVIDGSMDDAELRERIEYLNDCS